MIYQSPQALRTALEHRLLVTSTESGISLDRLRRRVMFERIIARIQAAEPSVGGNSVAFVDLGAVHLDLEGDPPASGLLTHGRAEYPGLAGGHAVDEPGHVLAGGHLTDGGQAHGAGIEGLARSAS